MDKISEEWSYLGITTTFRIQFQGGKPSAFNRTVNTYCGLGWQTGISADAQSCKIFFDARSLDKTVGIIQPSLVRKSVQGKELDRVKPQDSQMSYPFLLLSFDYVHALLPEQSLFELTVSFPTYVGPSLTTYHSPEVKRLLYHSLYDDNLIDTKFYLFSRRTSGKVYGPRPLYAASSLLKGYSAELDTLLFGGGYKESVIVDMSTTGAGATDTDKYDYESDSDLESVSEDESESDDVKHGADAQHVLTGDADKTSQHTAVQKKPERSQLKETESHGHPGRMGRMIAILDTAFATWKALLFYLYAREIVFLPLKSTRARSKDSHTYSRAPACSPKSMYRLADKLGIDVLKELSFKAIASSLTEENIVQELFSTHTSTYSQIQEMELDKFVLYHGRPSVTNALEKMVPKLVEGTPHSADVLSALFRRMVFQSPRDG